MEPQPAERQCKPCQINQSHQRFWLRLLYLGRGCFDFYGESLRDFFLELVLLLKGGGVFTAEGFDKLKPLIMGMSVPNVDQKNSPISPDRKDVCVGE